MARRYLPALAVALLLAGAIACSPPPDARTQALEAQNAAYQLAREGRTAEAIAHYTHAIALDPGLALSYHGRGVAYAGAGDYATAIADFDRALELDPGRAFTYFERGAAYYALADFPRAEADIQRSVDISGGDPDIFYPAQSLLDSIRSGDAALDAGR
jgi:tetratricopeptide (TPR) repeat protein